MSRERYTPALGIEDPILSIEFCICKDCGAYVATSYTEEHDAHHALTERNMSTQSKVIAVLGELLKRLEGLER